MRSLNDQGLINWLFKLSRLELMCKLIFQLSLNYIRMVSKGVWGGETIPVNDPMIQTHPHHVQCLEVSLQHELHESIPCLVLQFGIVVLPD